MFERNLRLSRFLIVAFALTILWTSVGCSVSSLPLGFADESAVNVQLNIETVRATEQPGHYTVIGQSNLPDSSQLWVSAVRQLSPDANVSFNLEPSYVILDRQTATVADGSWQASLKLWQIAADGRYQEAWQLTDLEERTVNPSDQVLFQVSLEPVNQTGDFYKELTRSPIDLQGSLVRYTEDGEAYIYASQSLAIALPTGRTDPPPQTPPSPEPRPTTNQPPPEPLNLDTTSAPPSPAEMLR
ncbi:MAG: hypothetical protein AAFX78_06875 [Cyanobacteria bacterium J06638_20]